MSVSLSKPQQYLVTTTQAISLFLAGVGSGKTYVIGLLSGYFIKKFPLTAGFIGANTYLQLTQSTMFRVRTVWREVYGWEEGRDYVVGKKPPKHFNTKWHEFDSYNSMISFESGAVVFVGSLDNAKAHDGKEFGWAFLDETKDSREDDVKEVIFTRLRAAGMYVCNKTAQIIHNYKTDGENNLSFNPLYILTSPAKVGWLNEWFNLDEYQDQIQRLIYNKEDFFKREFKDKSVVISNTYHNLANLPHGYVDRLANNLSEEKVKMLVYGNPFVRSGGEFYSGFQRLVHVKDVPYLEGLPIHISFDQNVKPYITATLYQIEDLDGDKKRVRQFDEMCLKNPRNTTSKLCLEFIKRWGGCCNDGLYFYGDPSGKKRDTRANEHDYLIIQRMLRPYLNNASNRVPYSHPSVLKRKDFINNTFEGNYDIEVWVDRSCKHSIADFDFVKEDVNGKKAKYVVKDKHTKESYEKYGHTSDSFDYFFCMAFKRLFAKHFK